MMKNKKLRYIIKVIKDTKIWLVLILIYILPLMLIDTLLYITNNDTAFCTVAWIWMLTSSLLVSLLIIMYPMFNDYYNKKINEEVKRIKVTKEFIPTSIINRLQLKIWGTYAFISFIFIVIITSTYFSSIYVNHLEDINEGIITDKWESNDYKYPFQFEIDNNTVIYIIAYEYHNNNIGQTYLYKTKQIIEEK